MRGADTRVSVCFCLGSRYTPDTQPDTQTDRNLIFHPPWKRSPGIGWFAMPPVPDVQRWESDEDSEDSEGEWAEDEKVGVLSEAQILRLMA